MPVLSEFVTTDRIIGDRFLEDYDMGMALTLGAQVMGDDMFINVPGVAPAFFAGDYRHKNLRGERMPGIHVIFATPDDRITAFSLPCMVIRRESVDAADARWPSGSSLKYQAPAPGATPVTVTYAGRTIVGWSAYQEQRSAWPYDITYMVSVISAGRRARAEANLMLRHILRRFPPKGGPGVWVKDSLGEAASYETFSESPVSLDEALDIGDRQMGFSVNIKVQALLDLLDPYTTKPVTDIAMSSELLP